MGEAATWVTWHTADVERRENRIPADSRRLQRCAWQKKKINHNIYTVNKYIKHTGTLSFWTEQSGSEIKLKLHLCENKPSCVFSGDKAFSCYDGSQLSLWLRIENRTLITSDRKTTTTLTAHSSATAKPHFLWRADGEHKERTRWLTRKGVRNTETSLILENSSFSFCVAAFLQICCF